KSGLDREREGKQFLPRLEMLQAAEKALTAVLLFHDSAVERGNRKGGGWKELRNQLVAKLQEVQFGQLTALAESKNWEAAFDLGSALGEVSPGPKDQAQIVTLLAPLVRESLQQANYSLARKQFFFLESQFPNTPAVSAVRNEFKNPASELVEAAKALEKQGKTTAAQEPWRKT